MNLHSLRFAFLKPGSAKWLIAKELAYGGVVTEPVRHISPHDPRSAERLKAGCMVGGDRMSPERHNYAPIYSEHLRQFIGHPVTLIEVGILRGTGLAIWADLFVSGRVIGLDIDLSNFQNNEQNLRQAGAFASLNVEVHEFDQFACSPENIAQILQGDRIDVFIDDGCHSDEAQTMTFKAILPHLKQRCVCFIEDNDTVAHKLRALAADFIIESRGQMTVLSRV